MLVVKTIALVALLAQHAASSPSPSVVRGHGEVESTSPSATSHFTRRTQPINLGAAMHSAGAHLKALKPIHLAGVVGAVGLGGAGLGYSAHRMGGSGGQITVGGHPDEAGAMKKRGDEQLKRRGGEGAMLSEAEHAVNKPVAEAAKTVAMSGKKIAAALGLAGLGGFGAGYATHSITHPSNNAYRRSEVDDVLMIKRNAAEAELVKNGASGVKGLLSSLTGKSVSEILSSGKQLVKKLPTHTKVAAAGAGGLGTGLLVGGHLGSKHGESKERLRSSGSSDLHKRSIPEAAYKAVSGHFACLHRRHLPQSGFERSCMHRRDDIGKRFVLPQMSMASKIAAGGVVGTGAFLVGGAAGRSAGRRESIKKQEQKAKAEAGPMSGAGGSGGAVYKRANLTPATKALIGLGVGGIGVASWAAGKHVGGLSGQADAMKMRPGGMGGGMYKRGQEGQQELARRSTLVHGLQGVGIATAIGGLGWAGYHAAKPLGRHSQDRKNAAAAKAPPAAPMDMGAGGGAGGGAMMRRDLSNNDDDNDDVRREKRGYIGAAALLGGGLAGYGVTKIITSDSHSRPGPPEPQTMMAY